MLLKRLHPWFLSLAILSPIGGCDGGDDDDGGDTGAGETGGAADESGGDGGAESGGGGLDPGFTDCTPTGFEDTPTLCQPGQFCEDSNLAICENGCLSNINCADDQTCQIPAGEPVGSCANNGGGGPGLEAFCEKLLTCDPSGTMAICEMFYAGTNDGCHQCILDENCGDINDFEGACDDACGLG